MYNGKSSKTLAKIIKMNEDNLQIIYVDVFFIISNCIINLDITEIS